ncbi:hypothetical protein OEZ86_000782 [Tetradesmus obliquus]|nr:hypothetical protein OEZ86_000782 [Tetradesmus obliquus]
MKERKDAYRAELEAQIRDKAARVAAEKSAVAAEEARKEKEMAGYNPWGRGGAGAPLRNAAGQAITDLRGGQQQQYQQQQYPQQQYQQQQQQGPAAAAGPGNASGPPPMFNFRSDKAFMTANEMENRQRAQRELQKDLDQQIQEKKRRKELEQRQAEEEARQEEGRLAAEQARLAAAFESEQQKQKAKSSGMAAEVEGQVAGAWNAAKQAAAVERRKSMDDRRRSQVQIPYDDPPSNTLQQDRQLAQQSSTGRGACSSHSQPADQQQEHKQQEQQQRQALMLEALRLEEDRMRQMAAQEVERLRADMEAQAAALRNVVERQGGEVAALRAAAAAAEAQSTAAKVELAQVRKEYMRKSQELPHETLSTILADYGDGPASAIAAAYHPAPIRRIDLELPPSAAAVRRSIQQRAGLGAMGQQPSAAAGGYSGYGGYSSAADALAGGTSAVELLESMLQQGRQPPTGSLAEQGGAAADAALVPGLPQAGRRGGLVTPGGSDLGAVASRNADKLQLLSSMPPPGDAEALDEFLANFVSKTSQPNQRSIATPPSRLLSAHASSNSRPPRHRPFTRCQFMASK